MNSSGEFLNGSRAAAVVGLLLPLGKGGQASVQAEPRQLWGLGGRDPQLGKSSSGHPRLNAGITRLDSQSTQACCGSVSENHEFANSKGTKKISSHPWDESNVLA